MHPIEARFVVFSAARSGSTALTVTLNSHPEVYCHGSPFYERDKGLEALRPEAQRVIDLGKRETDPAGYVEDILNFTPGPRIVGLKMWRSQAGEATKAVAANPDIKKIVLHRRNYLACYSSGGLVELKLRQPELFSDPARKPKLGFNMKAFRRYVHNQALTFQFYATRSQGEICAIPYTGLMSTGLETISDFLGLCPFDFKEKTTKRNSNDILNRFKPETHRQIMQTLESLRHPEWVRE